MKEKTLFFSIVYAMFILFQVMKRVDPMFKKAVSDFFAVYLFKNRDASRYLIFNGGGVSIKKKAAVPDFTLEFTDIPGAIGIMRDHPGDMLRLLLENKIRKTGNMYYLFKIGYLFGLCEDFFKTRLTFRRANPSGESS